MRVLTVGPVPPSYGGSSTGGVHTHVVELYRHMKGRSRRQILITNPLRARDTSNSRLREAFDDLYFPLPAATKLEKIQSVLSHIRSLPLPTLATALRIALEFHLSPLMILYNCLSLKIALNSANPSLLHVHMVDLPALYGILVHDKIPLVVTIHSFNITKLPKKSLSAKYARLVRRNLSLLQHAIAVSASVREEAMTEFGFTRTVLLPNGVDVDRYRPSPRTLAVDASPVRILFAGHLIERKNVETLVKAVASLVQLQLPLSLTIVGDGPERERLERLASSLRIEHHTLFLGRKGDDEMVETYHEHHIFVMPSTYEGLSIAMLEAMSCGLCVIAGRPRVGQYDALIDHKTGLAFDGGSVHDLAAKIRSVVEDPALRLRLGTQARQEVEERFSIQEIAGKTERYFESILHA